MKRKPKWWAWPKGKMGRRFSLVLGVVAVLVGVAAVTAVLATSPTLTTDKPDYKPEEVVHITGTNFAPNTTYAMPVLRPDGSIVTIDHFGNLITNVDERLVAEFARPRVRVAGLELVLHDTYGNVKPGDFVALINSFGVVEIARAEGSAADTLGLGRGAPVTIQTG